MLLVVCTAGAKKGKCKNVMLNVKRPENNTTEKSGD